MGGGHVILALDGSWGFLGGRGRNFTSASSDGIDLPLQRLYLLLDGNDAVELVYR